MQLYYCVYANRQRFRTLKVTVTKNNAENEALWCTRVALDACIKVIGPENFEIFDTLGVICLNYTSATWKLCVVYMICVDMNFGS